MTPKAAAVRKTVERILTSPDFEGSDRAANFLRYVVEERLEGRSDQIKAFTIAVDVFGRDESFDPQKDPAVRIEAARLRRALERYYLLSGKDDPIVIEIPKGSYIPTFTQRDTDGAAAPKTHIRSIRNRWWLLVPLAVVLVLTAGWFQLRHSLWDTDAGSMQLGPKILVLPFANLGDDDTSALYAAAITDELVGALAHFKEVAVFGIQTSRAAGGDNIANLRQKLQADYVVEGSARTDDQTVRVSSRLIDTESGAVRWSNTYEHRLSADELFRIPVETAAAVAGAIAQPTGVVFNAASISRLKRPPANLEAYFCSLKYYVYRDSPTTGAHTEVRDCLEQTVAQFPDYATAWALLAHTVIDEIRHRFNPLPEATARSLHAARQAIAIDPENARAHQAMATAHFYSGNITEAFDAAERALALNPNDSDLLGQTGQIFGLAGQGGRAHNLLAKALILNPGQADFNQAVIAFVCYTQRDYECAKTAIEKSGARQVPTYHGIAAMTYAQLGLDDKARAALADFNRIAPDFVANLWAELSDRNIPFDAQLHIAEGLQKAGANVPAPPDLRTEDGSPAG